MSDRNGCFLLENETRQRIVFPLRLKVEIGAKECCNRAGEKAAAIRIFFGLCE
jgi:hypothetical protein